MLPFFLQEDQLHRLTTPGRRLQALLGGHLHRWSAQSPRNPTMVSKMPRLQHHPFGRNHVSLYCSMLVCGHDCIPSVHAPSGYERGGDAWMLAGRKAGAASSVAATTSAAGSAHPNRHNNSGEASGGAAPTGPSSALTVISSVEPQVGIPDTGKKGGKNSKQAAKRFRKNERHSVADLYRDRPGAPSQVAQ